MLSPLRAFMQLQSSLFAIAVVGFLVSAAGQPPPQRVTESNTAAVRAQCAAAAALLRNGSITSANSVQIRDLRQCRESAGEVLPAAWMRAQADSLEIETLMLASMPVRDARIARPLEAILMNPQKPDLVRQAAAVVLASYASGRIVGSVARSPVPGQTWIVEIGMTSHLSQDNAPEPPDPALKGRLLQTFESLAGATARRTTFQTTVFALLALLRAN